MLPGPRISRGSLAFGHLWPAELFPCLFFKEIQLNTALISKHYLLRLPLLELWTPRQIMSLISAWRAGWGKAGNEDLSFSDKDLEVPGSTL